MISCRFQGKQGKAMCSIVENGISDKILLLDSESTEMKFVSAHQHIKISACAHWHTGQFAFAHWRSCPKTSYSANWPTLGYMVPHFLLSFIALCSPASASVLYIFQFLGGRQKPPESLGTCHVKLTLGNLQLTSC